VIAPAKYTGISFKKLTEIVLKAQMPMLQNTD